MNKVRFETRPSDGRERLRHYDGQQEQYVYVHRLVLHAWDPNFNKLCNGDRWHVHHVVPVPWLNTETNLEWHDADSHGQIEASRRRRADSGGFR